MLRLYHDFTSPAAALAVLRCQRLADEGLDVGFVGIDVLGLDRAVPPTVGLLDELEAHGPALAELGLEARRPSRQPPTLRAHLVGEQAAGHGLGAAWRSVCYRAFWRDDADLADPDRLAALADRAGLDPARARRRATDEEAARRLRRRMAVHRGEGVGGVPIVEVDGTFVPALLPTADLRHLAAL